METPGMLPCLHRPVLRQILGESQHQRFTLVEYINLFALQLRKAVCLPHGIAHDGAAHANEHDSEQAYLPEAALDVV